MTGSDSRQPRPRVKLTYDDFVLFPDDGNATSSSTERAA
jgi:hypothetical protein